MIEDIPEQTNEEKPKSNAKLSEAASELTLESAKPKWLHPKMSNDTAAVLLSQF